MQAEGPSLYGLLFSGWGGGRGREGKGEASTWQDDRSTLDPFLLFVSARTWTTQRWEEAHARMLEPGLTSDAWEASRRRHGDVRDALAPSKGRHRRLLVIGLIKATAPHRRGTGKQDGHLAAASKRGRATGITAGTQYPSHPTLLGREQANPMFCRRAGVTVDIHGSLEGGGEVGWPGHVIQYLPTYLPTRIPPATKVVFISRVPTRKFSGRQRRLDHISFSSQHPDVGRGISN